VVVVDDDDDDDDDDDMLAGQDIACGTGGVFGVKAELYRHFERETTRMLKIDDSLPLRYTSSGGGGPSSHYASGSGSYYSPYRGGSGGGSGISSGGLPEYFRRLLDYHQMDFESTFEDMTMLCSTNPQRV